MLPCILIAVCAHIFACKAEPEPPQAKPFQQIHLESIILPSIEFHQTPLKDALQFIQQKAIESDHTGDNIAKLYSAPTPAMPAKNTGGAPPAADGGFGFEGGGSESPKEEKNPGVGSTPITFRAQQISAWRALELICHFAGLAPTIEGEHFVVTPAKISQFERQDTIDELQSIKLPHISLNGTPNQAFSKLLEIISTERKRQPPKGPIITTLLDYESIDDSSSIHLEFENISAWSGLEKLASTTKSKIEFNQFGHVFIKVPLSRLEYRYLEFRNSNLHSCKYRFWEGEQTFAIESMEQRMRTLISARELENASNQFPDEPDPFVGSPAKVPETRPESIIPPKLDFSLWTLNKNKIKLTSLWDKKPTLLVSASISSTEARKTCQSLQRLRTKFQKHLDIVIIYTREACPLDAQSPYLYPVDEMTPEAVSAREKFATKEPQSIEERINNAHKLNEILGNDIRILVDTIDNRFWQLFGWAPNQAIIIHPDYTTYRQGRFDPDLLSRHIAESLLRKKTTHQKQTRRKLNINSYQLSEDVKDPTFLEKTLQQNPEIVHHLISTKGVPGETCLHLAAKYTYFESAKVLLNYDANPNQLGKNGQSPVHYALKKKQSKPLHLQLINTLLTEGGDIKSKSSDGRSGLHWAVNSGNPSHVDKALTAGAPLNTLSTDKISAIHDALFYQHSDIVNLLKAKGAAIDIYSLAGLGDFDNFTKHTKSNPESLNQFQGQSGRTPLIYATIGGHPKIVEYLLLNASYSNEHIRACLSKAIHFENRECGITLAKHARQSYTEVVCHSHHQTPQIPPSENYWKTPIEPEIHDAAEGNQYQILEAMLESGWQADELNRDGKTPLHLAAELGHVETMEVLIKNGATIDAKAGAPRFYMGGILSDPSHETPLHLAIRNGQAEAVKLLLENGASVTHQDNSERTAILQVVTSDDRTKWSEHDLNKRKKIITELLEAGASLDETDNKGHTLLDIVTQKITRSEYIDGNWHRTEDIPRNQDLADFIKTLHKKHPN